MDTDLYKLVHNMIH